MSKQAIQQKIVDELSNPPVYLEPAQSPPQNLVETMCALRENQDTYLMMEWSETPICYKAPLYIHDVLNVIKLVFEMVNVKFFRMSNENNLIVVLCNIFAAFKL